MLNVQKETREWYTNFVGGSTAIAAEPFAFNQTGSTAAQIQSVYPNNIGIQQLANGAATTDIATLALDGGSFLVGAAPHRFRAVFQLPALNVNYVLAFGFANAPSAITVSGGVLSGITDGVWFGMTAAQHLTLNYLDNSVGSTGIDVSGAVPAIVANTWYAAVIDVNVPIINSNQAVSPNLGGPTTGCRFYFGPQVPVATTGSFPSTNRVIGDIPVSKLPGFSDTRPVGAFFLIGAATATGLGTVNIDSLYVQEGLTGYV